MLFTPMINPSTQTDRSTYETDLDLFIRHNSPGADGTHAAVVNLFHAVRNLTYASTGSRSPHDTLTSGKGACTSKHILLRDLLRKLGEEADVCMVEGDFAAAVPTHVSMPEALRSWAVSGGVRDYHNIVLWRSSDGELRLDATWPDNLADYGFVVNSAWAGSGDTKLALTPVSAPISVEDIIPLKEAKLAQMSEREIMDRRRFLTLLTGWIEGLPAPEPENRQDTKPPQAAAKNDHHLQEGL